MIVIGPRTVLAKTCLRCGELKQRRDYSTVTRIYLNSYCHSCKNAGFSRPTVQKYQQESLRGASRNATPWTGADIKHLMEMVSEGLTGAQMAVELNRTLYSVYTMKNKLKETLS